MEESKNISTDINTIDLNPKNVKILIDHLNNLKANIKEILKLNPGENELDEVIKKINEFLEWLSKFKDENEEKTNEDYKDREQRIDELTRLLENYFKKFDEDETITKFILMSKLINYSKEIIDIINIVFDPSEEKKVKSQNNVNSSAIETTTSWYIVIEFRTAVYRTVRTAV